MEFLPLGRNMAQQAFFHGLVFDELGRPVDVKLVGDEAFYVVDDHGFLRHVEAEQVDRTVLDTFLQQLRENKDLAIGQAMRMMGQEDLMTKAALDAQVRNVSVDQILDQGLPQQARDMMGMVGFRIVIDHHGEVVRLEQPSVTDDDDY